MRISDWSSDVCSSDLPLLATRGPPGTHDVALACRTLDALRAGQTIALPRFDKLADRRLPESGWPRTGPVDPGSSPGQALVLFEGWFLGTPAEPDAAPAEPLHALEREEDPDGRRQIGRASWRARMCQ